MEVVKDLLAIFRPLIELIVITVGPAIAVWLSAKLTMSLNIQDEAKKVEIEKNLREALHASATNAVKYAVSRLGLSSMFDPNTGTIRSAAALEAVKYVIDKNPDAVKQFKLSPESLVEIITAKAKDVENKAGDTPN